MRYGWFAFMESGQAIRTSGSVVVWELDWLTHSRTKFGDVYGIPQGREAVTLDQLERAARSASTNPDGFLDKMVREKSADLGLWSSRCRSCAFRPGSFCNRLD